MQASRQDKVLVACPRCGHQQPEPRIAFSTVCRKCGQHIRVQEILQPPRPAAPSGPSRKRVTCFECGAELEVPTTAESTMCKRCSRYVDLKDYHIISAISKNFKTRGAFVIEPKGYVFNSETFAGDAVVKGRFLGKLYAERSLTIHSGADIKGTITAGRLVIPPENHFRWKDLLKVGSADIAGELVANLNAKGTILLKATARLFGNLEAGGLLVEEGAVVVGDLRIGVKR
jgi:cytoskeletal protein CcmA (bactofilin family)/DNA-directed RNA polymerase subunit RPC12/RpoP